ncbi:hypothetical protein HELRODRAFT_183366 [Helobdella robusta]|uniref:Uncharacterized protein n=1 Tax=Helobdella robusta TaxID=6412 RepID=T1FJI6_HELRO|nr:hypothetical protein HELRODRAFT_183366 [Helobdella robusta]ESO11262.1 hypothetical protein HELRODRAFT_183366 [Helobdella robusta]
MTILETITIYVGSFIASWMCYRIILRCYKTRKDDSKIKRPPCLPHIPLLGSLPFISDPKRFHVYFLNQSKKIGNIIGCYMGQEYMVVLNGRQTIEKAFVGRALAFSSRPTFYLTSLYNPGQKGFGDHPYNETFKKYHKACLNVFKRFGLGQEMMESRVKAEVEHLIQRIKLRKSQSFDPSLDLKATFFNVISSILFNNRWSVDDSEFLYFVKLSNIITRTFPMNSFPILRFVPYFKGQLKEFVEGMKKWDQLIEKKIHSIINGENGETFSSKFEEELKLISDDSIMSTIVDKEQHKFMIFDLIIGGTETSANTVLWFLYFMANHQDVQQQMRDELDRVVGLKRYPSLEDKPKLLITEACTLEVMRIKTLAPTGFPRMTLRDVEVDGVLIPKNVTVLANLYSAHMDPDVWDEPEKFNIERFLNEDRTEIVNKSHVIPFSIGKRSCLGEPLARQELFLVVSTLIQQFQILPPEGQDMVVADEVYGLVLLPSPFNIRFVERTHEE